jgi:hypothetical protein
MFLSKYFNSLTPKFSFKKTSQASTNGKTFDKFCKERFAVVLNEFFMPMLMDLDHPCSIVQGLIGVFSTRVEVKLIDLSL